MNEQLASILLWLMILTPIVVFARQIQHVRRGVRRKAKAALLFFSYSILPVLAYALVFLVLVGVEESTKRPAIMEGMARTLALVLGIGVVEVLLLTVLFAIVLWFLRVHGDTA